VLRSWKLRCLQRLIKRLLSFLLQIGDKMLRTLSFSHLRCKVKCRKSKISWSSFFWKCCSVTYMETTANTWDLSYSEALIYLLRNRKIHFLIIFSIYSLPSLSIILAPLTNLSSKIIRCSWSHSSPPLHNTYSITQRYPLSNILLCLGVLKILAMTSFSPLLLLSHNYEFLAIQTRCPGQ
jgi:hypothetical protein